jgi:hypothetical protein
VKKLLKKIFPILWLKRMFLLFNTLKIATWDRIVYRTFSTENMQWIKWDIKNPFLEAGIDLHQFPEDVRLGFLRWTDPGWTQDQYIVAVNGQLAIDPETGWAVAERNRLIYPSLGFANAPHVRKPGIGRLLFKGKVVRYKSIISLRDTGEENYFHFFNDILPKLWFLQENSRLDPEACIVVSDKLWRRPYFQYYLNATELKTYRWYVQQDEWVIADRGIFCKPFTHSKRYLSRAVELARPLFNPSTISKRVFLTRPRASLRYIENEEQIGEILNRYGFATIDSSKISFPDQVAIFSSTEVLIAVHGAGLTNILFRNGQILKVLELFPNNEYLPFHYIMLSKMFNYEYQAIQGRQGLQKDFGGFYVDPVQIEKYCQLLQ